LTDGLDSARAITDGTSCVTQGTNTEPFRNTGQQLDSETGLYDLRSRYYWSSIGWFTSRDSVFGSIRNPLALNPFGHVLDNLVVHTDPSGSLRCLPRLIL
jgi:RHS repeat-associated protein